MISRIWQGVDLIQGRRRNRQLSRYLSTSEIGTFTSSDSLRVIVYHALLMLCLTPITLQGNGVSDYYQSPVKHSVRLSGTFCELRPNHFHAGIDIRSAKGIAGDSIFSVAAGKLSRVRVQRSSYGQVLYIDHDNGTTSVYAHLDEFHPKIEKLVKHYQYQHEESEIDIYLDSTLVQIDKGDYIGTMGNTGRSYGAHLHFEIRDTATEEPINPFLYGFGVEDRSPPTLLSLWVYSLDKLGRILSKKKLSTSKGNEDRLKATITSTESPYIGIGIGAYDKIPNYKNYKGIYGATVKSDQDTLCTYLNDRFNFNENKGINGLIDYQHYKSTNSRVMKLFKMQHQDLSLFEDCESSRGIITLDSLAVQSLSVDFYDYDGNNVGIDISAPTWTNPYPQPLPRKVTNGKTYKNGNLSITIPPDALFEDVDLILKQSGTTYTIGSESIPLNKPITVTIQSQMIDEGAFLMKPSKNQSYGGEVKGSTLTTTISELGTFKIGYDTKPPVILTIRQSADRSKYTSWKFTVTDNIKDKSSTSSLQVSARIDDSYIRSTFDSKSNSLTIRDLDKIPENANTLRIIARDIHGNEAIRSYPL